MMGLGGARCQSVRSRKLTKEPEGVLGLADLPRLRSGALKVLAESAYPIDEGLVCRWA